MSSRVAVVLAAVVSVLAARASGQDLVIHTASVPQDPGIGAVSHPQDPTATGPRDNVKAKDTGSARISGRVLSAETGAPLRRAVVFVMGDGLKRPYAASTDENGRYEIKDLPAGRYSVNANKTGYGMMAYGQKRANQPGKLLEIQEGASLARIDFNLPKGGVITGRITDELGEPLANVTVRAMRGNRGGGKRQLAPVGFASTDDRGQFRIFGLAAADYYVAAVSGEGMDAFAQSESRDGFAPTYYPGTPSAAEAQRVRVAAGGEQSGINFALIPARGAKVSGTVITSSGDPAGQGFLMVQSGSPEDGTIDMRGGSMVQSDGTFELSNVTPGDYVLHFNFGRGDEDTESGTLQITVGGEDLSGLVLTTSKPSRLSGQLVFEGDAPASLRPGDFHFWMQPLDTSAMMMWGGELKTKDDWTVEGRASNGPVVVHPAQFPDGWTLKAVLLNGEDVTDSGIPTRGGEPVDGLQFVVTNRITKVIGSATDDLGRPAREYMVFIFPDDAAAWGKQSRRQTTQLADQQGRFEVTKLPPGHYLAAAVDSFDEGQGMEPEFLESLRASATPFDLREGETATVTLRLATRR